MDESLMAKATLCKWFGWFAVALGLGLPFVAEAGSDFLPDPTRPSAGIGMAAGSVNAGPVLQSIVISAGQRVATINGQAVKVGDKVGDMRVLKILETEVVLGKGKEVQTLKLFPGIEKQPAAGVPAARTK